MFYTSHSRRNRIVLIFTLAICTVAIAESSKQNSHSRYIESQGITEKAPATANMDVNAYDLAQDPAAE